MPAIQKYSEITNVRLSLEQKQWIIGEAERRGCSVSVIVREAIQNIRKGESK